MLSVIRSYVSCLDQAGCVGVLRASSATLARGCAKRLERRATDRALGRGFISWRTRIISSQSLACTYVRAWANRQSTIDNRPAALRLARAGGARQREPGPPPWRAPEVHASKNPARRPGVHRRCTLARTRPAALARAGGARHACSGNGVFTKTVEPNPLKTNPYPSSRPPPPKSQCWEFRPPFPPLQFNVG